MKTVLMLVHRAPYPPDKGDKIRSYNILRFLSGRYRVFLAAFVDEPRDFAFRSCLEEHCEEVFLRRVGRWRSKFGAAGSLLRGQALGLGYYRDPKMQRWIDGLLDREKIEAIFVFSSVMAQYLDRNQTVHRPVVADLVDVDSDKWRQYSVRSSWPMSLVYRYEARALQRWERQVAVEADAVTLVSDNETRLFASLVDGARARVETVRNGVEIEYFNPSGAFKRPYAENSRVVVFTGAMDYYANQEAVVWFARNAWPAIRNRDAGYEFFVVGSNPTKPVRDLSLIDGVTVTGRVPDIRPYLAHASVAIAPLMLARGVQNKVLEALAMNTQVVATPNAVQGLDGVLPEAVQVEERGSGFQRATLDRLLCRSIATTDGGGREFVRAKYDWNRNLTLFADMLFPREGPTS